MFELKLLTAMAVPSPSSSPMEEIAAALRSRARKGTLSRLAPRSCLWLAWSAAYTTQKFLRRIRILGVGLVAALLANFRHGAANRFHQLAGDFCKKT